jgi:prephenate dehydratase
VEEMMKEIRVAIQGVKGAFHHVAAMDYFAGSRVEPVECLTFLSLCESLKKGDCDIALMAIENSIAGSILPNYSLLEKFQFKVQGEVYLRIEMNLIGAQGTDFKNLLFVESHPMALAQCQDYLARFKSLQMIESADTALSVKRMQTMIPGWAAIGSSLSAELYGLPILASGIETNKQNYTRFLVIQRKEDYKVCSDANKTSLCFQTAHEPGALVRTLQIFEKNKVNMTKIQSVPILGRPKSYSFHCDLEWDSLTSYERAIAEIGKVAENIIHFGDYKSGQLPKN